MIAAASLLLDRTVPATVCAQKDDNWIGKRVMQRSSTLTLRNGNRVFDSAETLPFYRAERTAGRSLWLKAERGTVEGWAKSDDVIPLDEAADFFTARIGKDPRDPFLFAARARVRQDRSELDLALRDYSKAIELNPDLTWLYFERGRLWEEKKQFAKARADYDVVIERQPEHAVAYSNRGNVWNSEK